jgi:cytochrome c1
MTGGTARHFALACLLLLSGCGHNDTITNVPASAGNPDRGRSLIFDFACGSCHVIPGVADANGAVGPPLDRFGARTYIAGSLTNTTPNLVNWIRGPQQIEPGTAMPNLGVSDEQARHIAAYLHTLK